jgi:radical SAM superfamily enzyme YgiQ (UPF0313 family)
MKIKELYLICPPWSGSLGCLASLFSKSYPAVFAVIKGLTPPEYRVREFNGVFWREWYYAKDKLVAITCYSSNCHLAYKIAKEFKKYGSKVIMGGAHVTYNSDEALEFCDSVVVGEVEWLWPQIIADYENSCLKPKYFGGILDDFYSPVHKALLAMPADIVSSCLETTRGCKYTCEFCLIPSLSGNTIRHKPIDQVVELVEKAKTFRKQLFFLDNNIFADPVYSKELFRRLIPLKIKWMSASSIDIAKDDEALRLAKESGCCQLLVGYEVIAQSRQNTKGTKLVFVDDYLELTRKIKKIGIKVKAHFIFGFDGDNLKYLLDMAVFCFKLNAHYSLISVLTPFTGTRLYQKMIDSGRITNQNWRQYNCHNLVFSHPRIGLFSFGIFGFLKYVVHFLTSVYGRVLLFFMILLVIFL